MQVKASAVVARNRSASAVRRATVKMLRPLGLEKPARGALGRYRSARAAAQPGRSEEARRWAATKTEVQAVTAGTDPIVVGPWMSEVGFEVLYWIPFLRWLVERFEIDPARLQILSRGGTYSWYEGIADRYVDIFDFMTPDEFREYTEARWADIGGQKQTEFNKWDKELLHRAGDRLAWNRRSILHPSLMYGLFRDFWKGAAPIDHIVKHTSVTRLPSPPQDEWADRLPDEDFVTVKFYVRPSFPDLPANRAAIRQVVANLAERTHVVLLNTGLNVDDHAEVDPGVEGRVTWLLDGVPPNRNLHVQSQAISRSTGFIGTYGGLSYLAPLYGIPSIAYYSEPQHFLPSHLDFARRSAAATGGSIMTVSTRRSEVVEMLGEAA